MPNWFKTLGPLSPGWYWWRANETDKEPDCLQITGHGYIVDIAEDRIIEHKDYRGEWWGPLEAPK